MCLETWAPSTGTFLLYVSEQRGGSREEQFRGARQHYLEPAGGQGRAKRHCQEGERRDNCDSVAMRMTNFSTVGLQDLCWYKEQVIIYDVSDIFMSH